MSPHPAAAPYIVLHARADGNPAASHSAAASLHSRKGSESVVGRCCETSAPNAMLDLTEPCQGSCDGHSSGLRRRSGARVQRLTGLAAAALGPPSHPPAHCAIFPTLRW